MSTTIMVMMIFVGVVNKGNIWWLVTQYLLPVFTCGLIIREIFAIQHNLSTTNRYLSTKALYPVPVKYAQCVLFT